MTVYDGKPDPERTALYRHFDGDGGLLYIGISKDPQGRWMAHRGNREPWVHLAVRRTDEWHPSRPAALAAERDAVRKERPRFNGTHNYDDVEFDPSSWAQVEGSERQRVALVADLMRREISTGAWPVGYRIPSLRVLGAAAGVHPRLVTKASALLQTEGLLRFEAGRGLFVTAPRQAAA